MRDATFRDTVTVTLPPGLRGQLIDAARARGIIAGEFIRQALNCAVNGAASADRRINGKNAALRQEDGGAH
jgi:hypothetical protein